MAGSGIAWMVLAAFFFACMSACVKAALASAHPFQAVLVRSVVGLILLFFYARCRHVRLRGSGSPLLIMRGVLGFAALVLFFYALGGIPIGNASILNNTAPVFVVLLSASLLKERISRGIYLLLPVFLVGVSLIVKIEYSFELLPSMAALTSGLFSALAYMSVRKLRSTDSTTSIVFYFTAVSTVAALPLAWAHWVPVSAWTLALMSGAGIFATAGQMAMTRAYGMERAGVVSLFGYAGPVFAYGLGLVFFDEVPRTAALAGTAVLIACGWAAARWASIKAEPIR